MREMAGGGEAEWVLLAPVVRVSWCCCCIRKAAIIRLGFPHQLSEAAEYARKKGVVLKGDLPIGVDRNSVDTWVYPNLFRMNTSTGAPPDYFDKNGQNWGFPTYNWEEMSKDNYGWWRARLTQMGKYFTAYRIDHILGFFRIWELPEHAMTGLCGKFRPSIPISQEELESEGLWDFNRLTQPYIGQELLQVYPNPHQPPVNSFSKFPLPYETGEKSSLPPYCSPLETQMVQCRNRVLTLEVQNITLAS
ncbi:4-alpha-glucanotransferase DPE2 [Capsicum baccatum]|uniref:4-alpha-glucanotransferase n=1 Tax=Capsicum baccatum TaxID=33114 RepID=A0A2G2XB61_CAPBA|nr:4-alpha-glucanotransferase DPE2 [Capsicum baccatum]